MKKGKIVAILLVLACLVSPLGQANDVMEPDSVETVLENIVAAFARQDTESLASFWVYPIERRT